MTTAAWQLHASQTHLYPGARLRPAPGADWTATWHVGDLALVVFADQSVATGELCAVHDDGITLRVQPYRTTKGTSIPLKTWRLAWLARDGAFQVRRARVVA